MDAVERRLVKRLLDAVTPDELGRLEKEQPPVAKPAVRALRRRAARMVTKASKPTERPKKVSHR